MSEPKRIQLRRTKGYRKPEGAVVVARPSRWGNPFRVGQMSGGVTVVNRRYAVTLFRMLRHGPGSHYPSDNEIRAELVGRDLACWCPLDQPCHADVLLEIANAEVSR